MSDVNQPGGQQPQSETVTLTREQLNVLQRGQMLLQKLAQGPTKRRFENIVKEIVPEVETTDDQIAEYAAPYVEQLKATQERLDKFLEDRQKEQNDASEAATAAQLSRDFAQMRNEGLTEAGEEKVREIMVQRNVADPWAALALWEKQNPKPPEGRASWEPDSWNLELNAVGRDNDGLFKNPDQWTDQEVHNVLAEMRRGVQV